MRVAAVLSVFVACCSAAHVRDERKFPDDFIWGVATASYQIEGAWDADDKTENIWDHMTHKNPEVILDTSNGDIAADSYHNYKRDVEMMRELGVDSYRFSISWPRLLPSGFSNHISTAGAAFYNNYIDEMVKYNITPMATLYHWDLPQKLHELGGFTNPLFSDWFEDYARVAFELFGDRVKHWITFNEPKQICYQGYGSTVKIPMVNATGIGEYLCAKFLVMGHAKAYHIYNNEFRPTQGGVIGITININDHEPLTDSDEDEFAAELMRQAEWGLYSEPIYSEEGGFPKDLKQKVAEKSAEQGYPRSRMPEFTEEERVFVQGTYDFFGINHYTGNLVSATEYIQSHPVPSIYDDIGVGTHVPSTWSASSYSTLIQAPNSLFNVLMDVKNRYNNPVVYITENGWASPPEGGFYDDGRIGYYWDNLDDALDAIDQGVALKGYWAWSLMDNYEWMQGYTQRFGLYGVDFEDPARTRTPRKSAFVYKRIVQTRAVDRDYDPDQTMTMTIDEGH